MIAVLYHYEGEDRLIPKPFETIEAAQQGWFHFLSTFDVEHPTLPRMLKCQTISS